jgi:hypothetical protein
MLSEVGIPDRSRCITCAPADNPFVVELRWPRSQLVVSIWGDQDKTVRLQECFHELALVPASLSKFKFARAVVQAGTKLVEGPVESKFFECRSTLWDHYRRSSLRYRRPGRRCRRASAHLGARPLASVHSAVARLRARAPQTSTMAIFLDAAMIARGTKPRGFSNGLLPDFDLTVRFSSSRRERSSSKAMRVFRLEGRFAFFFQV